MTEVSLGIVTIATNIYIKYWESMVLSLESKIGEGEECVAHVFTDQREQAQKIKETLRKVRVEIHDIPAYKWPDATIRRYEVFTKFSSEIRQDVIMHLDADMLFAENIFWEITQSVRQNGISLVSHPGFWNKQLNLRAVVKNFFQQAKTESGSWEDRKISTAYVPPELRKVYVCGGIWAGAHEAFFKLTAKLDIAVEIDRKNGVMAVWHDESHLNKWASENDYSLLSPSYCFVNEYAHLKSLKPKVIALTKNDKTR